MPDELEEKLQGALGEKFEDRVAQKISEFGGLLTRRAAIRLLCKESGIDTERKIFLSAASSESLPFSFSARVDRIFPLQQFASGERCVRLHLSDSTGGATLVLWNAQAAMVEGGISTGDQIACRGAYQRSGELHLGREGAIAVEKKSEATQIPRLTAGACSVEGVVGEVEDDYHYVDKKTGGKKKMSSFQLCSPRAEAEGAPGEVTGRLAGDDCRRVIIWSAPEGTPQVAQGDKLLLENVLFRNGELHFNTGSRMVRKISAREKSGKLHSASLDGSMAVFEIGEGKFRLPLQDALLLLGITKVPPGVEPSTAFSIKASSVEGKSAKYHLDAGKLCWLRLEHGS